MSAPTLRRKEEDGRQKIASGAWLRENGVLSTLQTRCFAARSLGLHRLEHVVGMWSSGGGARLQELERPRDPEKQPQAERRRVAGAAGE
eukprot:5900435-Pleurochrysis_carterae.AAC.1